MVIKLPGWPRIVESTGYHDVERAKDRAEKRYVELKNRQNQGLPIKAVTLAQVLPRYLADVDQRAAAGAPHSSIDTYRSAAKFLAQWAEETRDADGRTYISKAVDAFAGEDWVKFREWRRGIVKRVILRDSSLNAVLQGVADLFKFCVRDGVLKAKPLFKLPYLPRDIDNEERSEFTLKEYNLLRRISRKRIAEARNSRNRRERQILDLAIGIMASTGIRTAEMMRLRFHDCEPKNTRKLGRRTCKIYIKGYKKKKGRDFWVPPRVWRWIQQLREIGGQPDDQPLMPWGDCEKSFTNLLNDKRLKLKLDNKEPRNRRILYSLRHSYAIWKAEASVPMQETCRIMGHTLSTHHRIYAREEAKSISERWVA